MNRILRVTSLLRELQQAPEHDLQTDEVQAFASLGKLSIKNALPEASFALVSAAAKQVFDQPLVISHKVEARHSRNVREVTLMTAPEGRFERWYGVDFRAPELAVIDIWTSGIVRQLGRRLVAQAYTEPGDMLQAHSANQVVIRRLECPPGDMSVYGYDYVPPTEHGVHVSLSLAEGKALGTHEIMPPNTLSIYAAQDLSEALKIEPPKYGFNASATRFSLEFVHSDQ